MGLVFIILYAAFCVLVAWEGRRTNLYFLGVLVLAILITPLGAALLLFLLSPRRKRWPFEDTKIVKKLTNAPSSGTDTGIDSTQ